MGGWVIGPIVFGPQLHGVDVNGGYIVVTQVGARGKPGGDISNGFAQLIAQAARAFFDVAQQAAQLVLGLSLELLAAIVSLSPQLLTTFLKLFIHLIAHGLGAFYGGIPAAAGVGHPV
jgi:hypothetical protein